MASAVISHQLDSGYLYVVSPRALALSEAGVRSALCQVGRGSRPIPAGMFLFVPRLRTAPRDSPSQAT